MYPAARGAFGDQQFDPAAAAFQYGALAASTVGMSALVAAYLPITSR